MSKPMIVFASGNIGKYDEIAFVLNDLGFDLVMQSELGIESVEETGLSFVENALIKARHAAHQTQYPVLADDSGLEVDYLRGQPGIHSARYSGDHDFDANITKLLAEMVGVQGTLRAARFCCVMTLMKRENDATPAIFEGYWPGSILEERKGSRGFGYDPIFWDGQYQQSAAEMPFEIKNTISHRAKAMAKLLQYLKHQ